MLFGRKTQKQLCKWGFQVVQEVNLLSIGQETCFSETTILRIWQHLTTPAVVSSLYFGTCVPADFHLQSTMISTTSSTQLALLAWVTVQPIMESKRGVIQFRLVVRWWSLRVLNWHHLLDSSVWIMQGIYLFRTSISIDWSLFRGTDNESAPHKYAIFWKTHRSFQPNDGGHFFIVDYEIRIQGASNTLVVWQPKNWHGTTLSAKGPNSQSLDYRQSGLSIVTPSRLPGIWKK